VYTWGHQQRPDTTASTGASGSIVKRAYGISPQTQALGLITLTLGPIDHTTSCHTSEQHPQIP